MTAVIAIWLLLSIWLTICDTSAAPTWTSVHGGDLRKGGKNEVSGHRGLASELHSDLDLSMEHEQRHEHDQDQNIRLVREKISTQQATRDILTNSNLYSLSLRGCYMGRDVVTECLRVTISNELPHLCHVILSQIGIDDEIFRKATVRNVSIPLSNHLQTLDLSHNPLSEKSIKHLSSIIARLPALQQLNLDGMFFIYKCMHVSVHSPPSTYQFMNVCMNVCMNKYIYIYVLAQPTVFQMM